MKKALEGETAGIKVNGIPINNIRYADDTIIIAENIDDLQRLMNKMVEYGQEYGLTINEHQKNKIYENIKNPDE